jgi:LysR family transcriptional regulator, regulator of gene expression of beta-lactamase
MGASQGSIMRVFLITGASIGVVGTFATGWLLPRLDQFEATHPGIELRLFTHNNRIDQASEGLDAAIRFGEGDWQGLHCTPVADTAFAPVCAPALAHRLKAPHDLSTLPLLRSYRNDEWPRWLRMAGVNGVEARGAVFDSSLALAGAAAAGAGVALLPLAMFERELREGRLLQPFDTGITLGRYWLTRLRSRREREPLKRFRLWLQAQQALSSALEP